MNKYKLYKNGRGYCCRVSIDELAFLFGYSGEDDPAAINLYLKETTTKYYIN